MHAASVTQILWDTDKSLHESYERAVKSNLMTSKQKKMPRYVEGETGLNWYQPGIYQSGFIFFQERTSQ
jgi:hypothetical protein